MRAPISAPECRVRPTAVAELLLTNATCRGMVMWPSHFSYICFMRAHLR
jgi:hypothetical protein